MRFCIWQCFYQTVFSSFSGGRVFPGIAMRYPMRLPVIGCRKAPDNIHYGTAGHWDQPSAYGLTIYRYANIVYFSKYRYRNF